VRCTTRYKGGNGKPCYARRARQGEPKRKRGGPVNICSDARSIRSPCLYRYNFMVEKGRKIEGNSGFKGAKPSQPPPKQGLKSPSRGKSQPEKKVNKGWGKKPPVFLVDVLKMEDLTKKRSCRKTRGKSISHTVNYMN